MSTRRKRREETDGSGRAARRATASGTVAPDAITPDAITPDAITHKTYEKRVDTAATSGPEWGSSRGE